LVEIINETIPAAITSTITMMASRKKIDVTRKPKDRFSEFDEEVGVGLSSGWVVDCTQGLQLGNL